MKGKRALRTIIHILRVGGPSQSLPSTFIRVLRALVLSALFVLPGTAAAEYTSNAQTILQVQYDAAGDNLWFYGAAGWGAPSCPNARFIIVMPSLAGRRQLMAIALAAHAAGKRVSFYGACYTADPNYFSANYIVAE